MKTTTFLALLSTLPLALRASAPLLAQDPGAPHVSLHVAALTGDVEAVRGHVAAGTDLDAKDPYGSTPLIIAATFDRLEIARILMDAGADLDLTNDDGGTALHTAAFLCRTEIVRDLLEHGARKYVRDHAGNTPAEAVSLPFEVVRSTYESIQEGLRPLGLVLDFAEIERTRPLVAEMLRPGPDELDAVGYAPAEGGSWEVSTPEAEGLDPALVAELFLEAADREALFGLLVVKDGRLVAESYFDGSSRERKELLQSVTKSYTSALVGIALERGCLDSVDQRMLEFFPDVADRVTDPRKREITLRQMLQMRAGYPWEETDSTYWNALLTGDYLPLVADLPLTADPGTAFQYSNLTSHWLGVVVSRACGTDLRSFAREHLFGPLGVEEGEWIQDRAGYFMGHGELRFTARDAARFGLLYLDDGQVGGRRIVPAEWIAESLQPYSRRFDSGGVHDGRVGLYHRDVGYGYQWWSARAGVHRFDYAWGHGGQFIILLDDLDMVIVLTSEPFYVQHDAESWWSELANLNLVGKFIASLPAG
ncbi:MAG: serine hydrolase [Gemmatimonadota bacterium]|jgi:CubicO group peptidase (beta-lactamase class C family)